MPKILDSLEVWLATGNQKSSSTGVTGGGDKSKCAEVVGQVFYIHQIPTANCLG